MAKPPRPTAKLVVTVTLDLLDALKAEAERRSLDYSVLATQILAEHFEQQRRDRDAPA
jgi:hypothetical protein